MNNLLYDSSGYVKVWVDGACLNNGRDNPAAGFGVVFNIGHPNNQCHPVNGRLTNNTAEIQAATCAINTAYQMNINRLCILTDSHFLMNAITKWMGDWRCHDWRKADGSLLNNESDFRDLDHAMSRMNVKVQYVPAHSGDPYNDLADRLAKRGAYIVHNSRY